MELNDQIKRWNKIVGTDAPDGENGYRVLLKRRDLGYEINKANKDIKNALVYDNNGDYARVYLEEYLNEHLRDSSISLEELAINPEAMHLALDAKALYDLVSNSGAKERVVEAAKRLMEKYGLGCSLEPITIARVRSEAEICSGGGLYMNRFSSGRRGKDIKLTKSIYQFDSFDSIIVCCAKECMDGITFGYVNNKLKINNCYVFIIKDGENIYTLSYKNNFREVYSLSDDAKKALSGDGWLDKEDSGKRSYRKIGKLENLPEIDVLWVVMTAEKLKERFSAEKELPDIELSYSRSMIKSPELPKTEESIAVQKIMPSITLPKITFEDTEGLIYNRETKGKNSRYLVERYKDEINPNVMNVVADSNKDSKETLCLSELVYTKDILEYKQKLIARYNYAEAVEWECKRDRRKKEAAIKENICELISGRAEEIVCMQLRGEICSEEKSFFGNVMTFDKWIREDRNTTFKLGNFGGWGRKQDYRCYFTQKSPGVTISIKPRNAKDIALVCGVDIKALPEELRHYDKTQSEIGRLDGISISGIVDPLTCIEDDFDELDFSTAIVLSKAKYLEFCEKAGVPAEKFWLKEPPACFYEVNKENELCPGCRQYSFDTQKMEPSLKCLKCKWRDKQEE